MAVSVVKLTLKREANKFKIVKHKNTEPKSYNTETRLMLKLICSVAVSKLKQFQKFYNAVVREV